MTDTKVATRDSRQTHPMPEQREQIPFRRAFTRDEFEKIVAGHIPEVMEDRWFAFFENGWIYFHRSWTGCCVYQVKLGKTSEGWEVKEAWINRDENQYRSRGTKEDVDFLTKVFGWSLGI